VVENDTFNFAVNCGDAPSAAFVKKYRDLKIEEPLQCGGSAGPGQGGQLTLPRPEIWSRGQKLHMAFMSDSCESNDNDHLSNFNR